MPPLMYCSIGVVPEMCPITHIQARRSSCMQQRLAKSIYRAPEFAKGMKWAANADCFLLWLSAAPSLFSRPCTMPMSYNIGSIFKLRNSWTLMVKLLRYSRSFC